MNITSENLAGAVKDLRSLIGELPDKDHKFISSLCDRFEKRGELSSKQTYWIGIMLERAVGGPAAKSGIEVKLTNPDGIFDLFAKAKENGLKWPKITFEFDEVGTVQLSQSGKNAKCPGTINMTDGMPYGSNRWYGRINTDGEIMFSPAAGDGTRLVIGRFMQKLADSPSATVAAYGRKSGHCCFCHKTLTTDASLAHGYGPVCAKNFGLPWGKKE